ncbi:hypothetical protein PTR73_09930 [Serratia nevei]|uniref:hypothetical protein n=1 Tax=Serratia nevei TaxID=2703794 RepID=UPI00313EBA3B
MLDFFKELISAVRATAVERVKNPILGALTFSWCAFNWDKILILFFSSTTIEEKIKYINDHYTLDSTILYPIYSAVAITLVLPIISAFAVFCQNKPIMFSADKYADRNDRLLKRKINSEEFRALADIAYERVKTDAQREIQAMISEIEKSKADSNEMNVLIQRLQEEIDFLSDKLKENETAHENYKKENARLSTELKRSQKEFSAFRPKDLLDEQTPIGTRVLNKMTLFPDKKTQD